MRFRLYPTREQEVLLRQHCAQARFVWNLAVEQLGYRHHHQPLPNYVMQSQQLTEARAAYEWLRAGSQTLQQQALRDFSQAMANWRAGSHRRPTWRKRGRHEGFRIVGPQALRVEQINRRWSRVAVPKVGWVRLRRSRTLADWKSYRVTCDSTGRWHIAFAVIPSPLEGPGDGSVVGIDRGVAVTLALSDGSTYQAPSAVSVQSAARALSRCQRGSNRRKRAKARLARLHARAADRRRDFVEKTSTTIATRYDVIRIEDLRVANMVRSARRTVDQPGRKVAQKAGLNRSILNAAWTAFATRLEHKAAGRVERVDPAFTSQCCSVCGHVAAESRKNQALFRCVACAYTANADVNAARNIAAGRAVTARGGPVLAGLVNREPQRGTSSVA
ncbi:MAG TPA: transposase [Pseudonocardiaceae bacterium]